jgi:hypothetical protein
MMIGLGRTSRNVLLFVKVMQQYILTRSYRFAQNTTSFLEKLTVGFVSLDKLIPLATRSIEFLTESCETIHH